jgi:hypothetical protein
LFRRGAREARLHSTRRCAPIPVDEVAIIAGFSPDNGSVTATGSAGFPLLGANPARIGLASGAAISGSTTRAVVALLTGGPKTVAADFAQTKRGFEPGTDVIAVHGALRAAIAGHGVTVVAALAGIDPAIATPRDEETLRGTWAGVARLGVAARRTSLTDRWWIAAFIELDDAVATFGRDGDIRGEALAAWKASLLVRRIANLARFADAVAAHDGGSALARRSLARKEWLDPTRRRTTITRAQPAVVAGFASRKLTVAANRCAALLRAPIPDLYLTSRGATVAIGLVLVVALLLGCTVSVATNLPDASLSGNETQVARLELAFVRTPVPTRRCSLTVVAVLSALAYTVATTGQLDAGLARASTTEPSLDCIATRRAAVTRVSIAVVAAFLPFDDSIAADHPLDAGFARRTRVPRVLLRAVR